MHEFIRIHEERATDVAQFVSEILDLSDEGRI